MKIDNVTIKVIKGVMTMMKVSMKNDIYSLYGNTMIGEAIVLSKRGCLMINYAIKNLRTSAIISMKS